MVNYTPFCKQMRMLIWDYHGSYDLYESRLGLLPVRAGILWISIAYDVISYCIREWFTDVFLLVYRRRYLWC